MSSAEYSVNSVGMNTGKMHIEGFVLCVHSWQNGTRCRDGVTVLWCHSHLVWFISIQNTFF